jgi:hypothetical protein
MGLALGLAMTAFREVHAMPLLTELGWCGSIGLL